MRHPVDQSDFYGGEKSFIFELDGVPFYFALLWYEVYFPACFVLCIKGSNDAEGVRDEGNPSIAMIPVRRYTLMLTLFLVNDTVKLVDMSSFGCVRTKCQHPEV